MSQLIFQPGFSTAEKVSDVSGRGVGMDVVRKQIQKLRGSVDLDSMEGKGATFSLRLPLTLAIIDGLVVVYGLRALHSSAGVGERIVPSSCGSGFDNRVARKSYPFATGWCLCAASTNVSGSSPRPRIPSSSVFVMAGTDDSALSASWWMI